MIAFHVENAQKSGLQYIFLTNFARNKLQNTRRTFKNVFFITELYMYVRSFKIGR